MHFLGIEIGGTKLQAAIGDGAGKLFAVAKVRAEPEKGAERIRAQILELVQTLFLDAKSKPGEITAAGIGFGGPVDSVNGIAVCSHQVEGWDRFPILRWFEENLGIRSRLGNDADLAGLAEARLGAGKNTSPVVYMNIGSGIGGAIVLNGELFSGQGLGAAEIGHMRIAPAENGTGAWQTLESLASGWAIANAARQVVANGNSSLRQYCQGDPQRLTTEHVVEAVKSGDPTATAIWNRAVDLLAVGVANVITLLDPQTFVIGGGVAEVGPLLFDRLNEKVNVQMFQPYADTCRIVPASLEEAVVLHGAILLAGS